MKIKQWLSDVFYDEYGTLCMLIGGLVIGFVISDSEKKKTKNYPIEVKCHWETDQGAGYPTMDADSVKGDTIYKDGLRIVNKNIINIQFK
jgi:hypothetical protein